MAGHGRLFAIGALAVVLVGGLVALLLSHEGRDTAPSRQEAATTTATAAATAIPSVSPPASPTPANPFGLPVQDLVVGEPAPFPSDLVLYYAWAGIEGPAQNLWRTYRGSDGNLHSEDLYERLPPGQPFTAWFDFDAGLFAVGLCRKNYCGGYGFAQPDSEAVLAVSTDGGATWAEAGRLPLGWLLVGHTLRGFLGVRLEPGSSVATYSFFPSGDSFMVPEGQHAFGTRTGDILLEDSKGRLTDEAGNVAYDPPVLDVEGRPRAISAADPWRWSHWHDQETASSGAQYFGERDGTTFKRVLRWRGGYLSMSVQLDRRTFVGRLDPAGTTDEGRQPVLVDVETATIHPMSDLAPSGGRYFAPRGSLQGAFTVASPGAGCLNVREAPSLAAPVVSCVAEGVLLELLSSPPTTVDGITWTHVAMVDGRWGWASAEFLGR